MTLQLWRECEDQTGWAVVMLLCAVSLENNASPVRTCMRLYEQGFIRGILFSIVNENAWFFHDFSLYVLTLGGMRTLQEHRD